MDTRAILKKAGPGAMCAMYGHQWSRWGPAEVDIYIGGRLKMWRRCLRCADLESCHFANSRRGMRKMVAFLVGNENRPPYVDPDEERFLARLKLQKERTE